MTDIRDQAKRYRKEIEIRSLAHEASSEWHRGRGVKLGGAATLLSALVGTSIFVTLTTRWSDLTFSSKHLLIVDLHMKKVWETIIITADQRLGVSYR